MRHNVTSCLIDGIEIDGNHREKLYLRYNVEPKYVNPKHTMTHNAQISVFMFFTFYGSKNAKIKKGVLHF